MGLACPGHALRVIRRFSSVLLAVLGVCFPELCLVVHDMFFRRGDLLEHDGVAEWSRLPASMRLAALIEAHCRPICTADARAHSIKDNVLSKR